jgi:nucleotide-binding universal stress UspA family protein
VPLPKRIVIATDFSPGAEEAGHVALAWAELLGAELHWAHGLEHLPAATPPHAAPLVTSYVEQAERKAREGLTAALESSRARGVKAQQHRVDAPAARGVVELARKLDADCVIVGSRGHGRLQSLLLGSVAERIARDAPCQVLVVRGRGSAAAPGTIVLGDDLGEGSRAARREAFELAARLSARVDMVHTPDLGIPYLSSVTLSMPDRVFDDLRIEASQQMDILRAQAPSGVEVTKVVAQDDAAHAICARAKEVDAGLVVVGTRSPGDVERVLLGSVANKVVRHAPCSVLVVR